MSSSCARRARLEFLVLPIALALVLGSAANAAAADDTAPPAQAEARNVQTVHFFSKALNQTRAFNLILPLDYETSTSRYPVLYLLHGLGGDNTNWTLDTNLSRYAARYRLIIVMPDGSDGWYVNSAGNPQQRFEDQIIQDLIPYVEGHYRTIPLRRARAIAGLSMGGFGAMFLGLKHPDMFSAIASLSGALGIARWTPPPNASETVRKAYQDIKPHFGSGDEAKARDPFELVAKVPAPEMPMLYLAEGGEDFLIQSNHDFVALLAQHRIPYEYREVSPREHTWDFWDEQIQVVLAKLARLPGFESGGAGECRGGR